jgi:hypothetical protein
MHFPKIKRSLIPSPRGEQDGHGGEPCAQGRLSFLVARLHHGCQE